MKEIDKSEDIRRYEEQLDAVRFDGDIDMDREKTREQLGFRDTAPADTRQRMKDCMAAAKAEADRRSAVGHNEKPHIVRLPDTR